MGRSLGATVTYLLLGSMLAGLPLLSRGQGNLPSPTPSAPSQTPGSQTSVSHPAGTQGPAPARDSLKTTPASKDSLAAKAAALPKSRTDSVLVAKHSFNHRQQIITGSVVMTCLALIMVTMNNYNPH